ncbi:hypothetical protein ACFC3F_06610 [Microbacterium sp. NPDC055910]|uniref:hypothetical protein n=1 Tax=Microbacterium sp. NPDC055910 TaxID=3345659 RepID=UPI0035E02B29
MFDHVDSERAINNLPALCGWRRRHDGCATTSGIVAEILGNEPLPYEIAGAALGSLRRSLLIERRHPDPIHADVQHRAKKPRPWAHVTDADREVLRKAIDRVRAQHEPRRCVNGACAWCGVSKSIGWRSSPETWADGSDAPLCRACAAVWESRGKPTDRDSRRRCALEALSGAAGFHGDGLGIRAYIDLTGDDHSGTDQPWQYAPAALEAIKDRARMTWPSTVTDPQIRNEYAERARREHREAQEAVWAAIEAERAQAEAEAARAAGWVTNGGLGG